MKAACSALAACAALLAGCASEVRRQPVDLVAAIAERGQRFVTTALVEVRPDSGYSRTIPPGTEFMVVGRIAQGLVLRPTGTVLTLEGKHMHEAYAVRDKDMLVGFYLPVERAYASLPNPPAMPLSERKEP